LYETKRAACVLRPMAFALAAAFLLLRARGAWGSRMVDTFRSAAVWETGREDICRVMLGEATDICEWLDAFELKLEVRVYPLLEEDHGHCRAAIAQLDAAWGHGHELSAFLLFAGAPDDGDREMRLLRELLQTQRNLGAFRQSLEHTHVERARDLLRRLLIGSPVLGSPERFALPTESDMNSADSVVRWLANLRLALLERVFPALDANLGDCDAALAEIGRVLDEDPGFRWLRELAACVEPLPTDLYRSMSDLGRRMAPPALAAVLAAPFPRVEVFRLLRFAGRAIETARLSGNCPVRTRTPPWNRRAARR